MSQAEEMAWQSPRESVGQQLLLFSVRLWKGFISVVELLERLKTWYLKPASST